MRLENYTSIKKEILKEIIRFVRPPNISNFDITIKNSKSWGGGAYYKGCSYHSRTHCPYVVIRISDKLNYPLNTNPRQVGGYLKHVEVYSRLEFIVYMIAHELRHLWQSKIKKGWRYYSSRGQFSERDCDCYALHKLREWRRN